MTQEEINKLCSTCKNRKFSVSEGLLCGKTGLKPDFADECPDVDLDAQEVERQRVKEEELAKSDGITGFLAFYVFWSIPIGIALTIVSLFLGAAQAAGSGIFMTLYAIAFYGFYFYFSAYTIYAFVKKKSDAVFIAKYQLIILFVNNLLVLFAGGGDTMLDNPGRLGASLIWTVVFFVYLVMSDDVNERIPRETRKLSKLNKPLVILSIVLPVLFFIGAVYEITVQSLGYSPFASGSKKIEQLCENTLSELPLVADDGCYWVDVQFDGKAVEYRYEYTAEAMQNFYMTESDDYWALLEKYVSERLKINIVGVVKDNMDIIVDEVIKSGIYDLRYLYCSPTGEKLFSVTLSNSELTNIAETGAYDTSTESMAALVESFNRFMPSEYFPDCILNECSLSDDGSVLHYDLELVNMNMGVLSGLTQDYLKTYMLEALPYFTDAPTTIARLNGLDISYDFTADCSGWWNVKVFIDDKEYKENYL